MKNLVIVESPTKAKTIGKILGRKYSVVSTMGHVIDLPRSRLGVEIDNDFAPQYIIMTARKKVVSQLKKDAKDCEHVYIATDPDREGEAIGWHLKERLFPDKSVHRVVFHEITSEAIKHAFEQPREFDRNMVEAQAGRRILDRIVGYHLSPLLWKKITRGLSAGRVQSVALRLIVEREKQIRAFTAQEYWQISAQLRSNDATGQVFTAKLSKVDGQKAELKDRAQAQALVEKLKTASFTVSSIEVSEKNRNPAAPFITSTLQQEAFNKLRFNAQKTMLLAQQLYEGIDIGEDAPVGLITYMRTDSTNIAAEAVAAAREHIARQYGADYLPAAAPVYKSRKFAQQAHEAIRPTLISRPPETLKSFLDEDQYRLYLLIYNRFLACQMNPSRYRQTSVSIDADTCQFSASGSEQIFDGFLAVYQEQEEESDRQDKEKEAPERIPALSREEALALVSLEPTQHFTKPPARYSDSSLVKALEEQGIGRPSTYAPTIFTLIQRGYVHRLKGYLSPSDLGIKVCDMLVAYFPEVIDVKFTAFMEEELDQVEEGTVDRLKVLRDFYTPFKHSYEFALENIKKEVETTDQVCQICGKPMVVKWGRKGRFLSCSGFPECKNAKSITSGVTCPQPGCDGELVERRSRRGTFYGCTRYPKCTFTAKNLPGTDE